MAVCRDKGDMSVKRVGLLVILVVGTLALASPRAQADEVTVGGTTTSATPVGITFTNGSFLGTTSGGVAGFSSIGAYTLASTPGTYSGASVNLTITFSVPQVITGGATTNFVATVLGSVNTNSQGGVDIVFANPSQTFTYANAGGSGAFTFLVNNVSINPGGSTSLSAFVTNAVFTPVPEPSTRILLGAGLLVGSLLGLKKLG